MTTPLRRALLLAAFLAAVVLAPAARAAELTLHVFDVGQGDAMLVVSPAGKTVLIDGGTPASSERLTARVRQLVPKPLDLMLMTHPHADHLGGLESILDAVGARIFMEPGFNHTSPLYKQLLEKLEDKKVPLKIGEAGRNIDLGGGASMRLLAPPKPHFQGTRSDANANSIVLRLTYGTTAFYLAADSEHDTERRILASGEELSADVYKVAHHGSRHASSEELLARIRPKVAVVCVGAGNDYGHPTRAALDRLHDVGAHVLRTDLDGEIVFKSDGEKVTFATEKGGEVVPGTGVARPTAAGGGDDAPAAPASSDGYAASRNSKVFHLPSCPNVARIKPSNLMRFDSREEAVNAGKRPAHDCNP